MQANHSERDPKGHSVRPSTWICSLAWTGLLFLLAAIYPLSYDEFRFYAPAIHEMAAQFPWFNIADYAMPNPPFTLLAQALVYHATTGSLWATRGVTVLSAGIICFALLWDGRASKSTRAAWLVAGAIVLNPTILSNSFQLKHHLVSHMGMVIAILFWSRTTISGHLLVAAGLFCAALSSQLALPVAIALLLRALFDAWSSGPGQPRLHAALRAGSAALPLVLLGALFVVWGGTRPPRYLTFLLESEVGLGRFNIRQLLTGLFSLGVWWSPLWWSRDRRTWLWILLMCPFAAWAVHASDLFSATGQFARIVGPLSSVFRVAHLPYWISMTLYGAGVSAGIYCLVQEFRKHRERGVWLVALLFIGMMDAVPYFFESYYVYLIVPVLAWERKRLWFRCRDPQVGALLVAAMVMGVGYTLIHEPGILKTPMRLDLLRDWQNKPHSH